MKKICLLTLLLTFSMGLFAESFTKNEYLLSAQDLLKQAELAFEEFRYEESLELVAKANAALDASHNYVRGSIIKTLASNSITKAKERMEWAKSIDAPTNFPLSYEAATDALAMAESSFSEEDFDTAEVKANEVIELVGTMKEVAKLPQYYVVRPWAQTRDCFWTISARPYVYNNPTLWENLYQANKSQMRNPQNPNLIYPAMRMFIPSIAGEEREGTYDSSKQYEPFAPAEN
ncbi:MAG: hypothetical protein IIW10_05015 [Spirochaetaceae bacterium]|nr:hypothetical protein [Spirochaetaceae bacterium]